MLQELSPSSVTFGVEPFGPAYREATELLKLHWHEIARDKELLWLNPDEEKYARLDQAGMLCLVTGRAGERLVGYFLWILTPHPHYKHVLVAQEDLHFLLPEYRQGLTGYRLLMRARTEAKARGAQVLAYREKIGHVHPALMERLGAKPTDIVYTEVVTEK